MTRESDRALLQEALQTCRNVKYFLSLFTSSAGQEMTEAVIRNVENLERSVTARLAQPAAELEFEDQRVQTVYQILCDDERPPKGEHWEGFAARKIVAALEQPAAQPIDKCRDGSCDCCWTESEQPAAQPVAIPAGQLDEADICTVVGVKADGTEHVLGTAAVSPITKARDILRSYGLDDFSVGGDDWTNADAALQSCKDLIDWMKKAGWTPPGMLTQVNAAPAVTPTASADVERDAVLQTCNCRWDGDTQVQQCTLHEAHVDAIHEWADRAKEAEAKLRNIAAIAKEQP